ncbi:Hypp5662 [Branchiostoma lanceolatum]|uniref:Hypp5662 protein n=1 Tax=Branchiostoma lanceolatum TaxID=7740 RepID=A0A8J9YLY4_BRALA|nr:Hypp5662 [Branchiostoma lanceolatum]
MADLAQVLVAHSVVLFSFLQIVFGGEYCPRNGNRETTYCSGFCCGERDTQCCASFISSYWYFWFCLIGFFLMMLIGVMYACCRQSKSRQTVSTTNTSGGSPPYSPRTGPDGVGYSSHTGGVTLPPPYPFGAPPVKPPPYSAADPPPPYSSVGDIHSVTNSPSHTGVVNNSYVHQQ